MSIPEKQLGLIIGKLMDRVKRLEYLWTQRRSLVPSGVIFPYGGSAAPNSEFLLCDGSAVSRSTYAALFDAIGTTYGAGDGSTTFNVPNLNASRFPRGSTSGGGTGGEANHTLTIAEMPAHDHGGETTDNETGIVLTSPTDISKHDATGNSIAGKAGNFQEHDQITHAIASQGGGSAHNNLPPYVDCRYIIKT